MSEIMASEEPVLQPQQQPRMPKALNAVAMSLPQPTRFFQYTALCESVLHYLRYGPIEDEKTLQQFLGECRELYQEKSEENKCDSLRDPNSLEQTVQSFGRFQKVLRPTEKTVCQASNKRDDGYIKIKSLFTKELYYTSVHKEGHFRAMVLERGRRTAIVIFPQDFSEKKITHVFYPGESIDNNQKSVKGTRPSYASFEGLRNCQEHLLRLFGVIGGNKTYDDLIDASQFEVTVVRRNKRKGKKEVNTSFGQFAKGSNDDMELPSTLSTISEASGYFHEGNKDTVVSSDIQYSGAPHGAGAIPVEELKNTHRSLEGQVTIHSTRPCKNGDSFNDDVAETMSSARVEPSGASEHRTHHEITHKQNDAVVDASTHNNSNKLNPRVASVVHEIYSSEVKYVKYLQELYFNYALPLSPLSGVIDTNTTTEKSQRLSPPEYDILFHRIQELLKVHERLEKNMRETIFDDDLGEMSTEELCSPEFSKHVKLGDSVSLLSLFAQDNGYLYEQYIGNSSLMVSMLRWLRQHREKVYANIQKFSESSSQSLESLVMMPVQRLPRYLLLLKELSRKLPSKLNCQLSLESAIEILDDIARRGETLASDLLHHCALLSVEARLRPAPVPGLTEVPENKLMFEGFIHKLGKNRRSKEYYCFIMNGYLVYGTPQKYMFAKRRNSNFGSDLDGHSRLKAEIFVAEMKQLHPALTDRSDSITNDLVSQYNSITLLNAYDFANETWLKPEQSNQLPDELRNTMNDSKWKQFFYIVGDPKCFLMKTSGPKDRKLCKEALKEAVRRESQSAHVPSTELYHDSEDDVENNDANHTNARRDDGNASQRSLELELQQRRLELQRRQKDESGANRSTVQKNAQVALKSILHKDSSMSDEETAAKETQVKDSTQFVSPKTSANDVAGRQHNDGCESSTAHGKRKVNEKPAALLLGLGRSNHAEEETGEKPLSSVYAEWKEARRSSLRESSRDVDTMDQHSLEPQNQGVDKQESELEHNHTEKDESIIGNVGSARQISTAAEKECRGPSGIAKKRTIIERPASVPSQSSLGNSGMARHASNKSRVVNGLKTVLLAGPQNEGKLKEALDSISESPDPCNFVVLFRSVDALLYRALYRYSPQEASITKIHGKGPLYISCTSDRIQKFLKYNTGSRAFEDLPTKRITVTTDGICVSRSNMKGASIEQK